MSWINFVHSNCKYWSIVHNRHDFHSTFINITITWTNTNHEMNTKHLFQNICLYFSEICVYCFITIRIVPQRICLFHQCLSLFTIFIDAVFLTQLISDAWDKPMKWCVDTLRLFTDLKQIIITTAYLSDYINASLTIALHWSLFLFGFRMLYLELIVRFVKDAFICTYMSILYWV